MEKIHLLECDRVTTRRQVTFDHQVWRSACYSFDRPWKGERVSWHWNLLVDLNLERLYRWCNAQTVSLSLLQQTWNSQELNFYQREPENIKNSLYGSSKLGKLESSTVPEFSENNFLERYIQFQTLALSFMTLVSASLFKQYQLAGFYYIV